MRLDSRQSGMTLVEVLVAVVLVALLASALVGIGAMVSGGIQSTLSSQDEYNIVNTIHSMLESENSCRLALGGPSAFGASAVNPAAQTVTATGNANLILYKTQAIDINRPVFLNAADPTNNTIGQWKATAITIQPVSGTFSGAGVFPAQVSVTLAPKNNGPNTGYIENPVYLGVRLELVGATLKIASCFPTNFNTTGQPAPICPPYFVPNTTVRSAGVAVSSGPYLGCRQIQCDPASLKPHATGGWDPDGNINCGP